MDVPGARKKPIQLWLSSQHLCPQEREVRAKHLQVRTFLLMGDSDVHPNQPRLNTMSFIFLGKNIFVNGAATSSGTKRQNESFQFLAVPRPLPPNSDKKGMDEVRYPAWEPVHELDDPPPSLQRMGGKRPAANAGRAAGPPVLARMLPLRQLRHVRPHLPDRGHLCLLRPR